MEDVDMKSAALEYAKKKWDILPLTWKLENGSCSCNNELCDRIAKHPLRECVPHGIKDATAKKDVIEKWWTDYPLANIGLATGARSGIVVIDCDGVEGFISLQNYAIPTTVRARSGRVDGGEHIYFQHPGMELKSTADIFKNGSHVDSRSEDGYVILPPSMHESGNRYEWINSPFDTLFAVCPDWVIERIAKNPGASTRPTNNDNQDDDDDQGGAIYGSRNTWLTQQAGHLRRLGLEGEGFFEALNNVNINRCDPPLAEYEVRQIANNALSWKAGGNIIKPGFIDNDTGTVIEFPPEFVGAAMTDTGNAECFRALYGGQFKYCPEKKSWYTWTKSHWVEDIGDTAVRRAMIQTVRSRAGVVGVLPKKERPKLIQHCNTSENSSRLNNALAVAGVLTDMNIKITDFDNDPYLLATTNGVYELKTGEFRPAREEDYISKTMNTDYNPDAECPLWEKTVNEVFQNNTELIAYFQRAIGYSLTGDMKEQAFFINWGHGANGKSTILGILRKLFGDYGATVPFDTFDADLRNAIGNDIARLQGIRFVTCIESEHSRRLAEARVKSITGGDEITCRYLYGEFFSFEPQFKIMLAVNHLPRIEGGDFGIVRRIHLVPYEQRFSGKQEDKDLKDKLAYELSGILNWAIEGYNAWIKTGLRPPSIVQEAVQNYQRANDQIGRWMDEKIEVNPDATENVTIMYNDYRDWCIENGEKSMGSSSWSQRLVERNMEKYKGTNGRAMMKGLKLADTSIDTGVDSFTGVNPNGQFSHIRPTAA